MFSLDIDTSTVIVRSMPKAKSRSNGKLIDTWYYEYEGIPSDTPEDVDEEQPAPKVQAIKVPIKLSIFKKFNSATPPLAVSEVWFGVECEKPEFFLTGSDIEALRAAMWEKLDEHFAVKWENYYLVEIRHDHPYQDIGTGLVYGYETVEKGTAFDGTLLLRKREWSRGDVISPWPGEFRDERGNVIACVPCSDVNRKALEEFGKRIDLLREKLIDLVRPDAIEQTLFNLTCNNFLLPAPEDES